MKKLYRIEDGRKIWGVCGGIAEYFNIDPTIVRIIWAICACFWGAGIFAYIICAIIIPTKSEVMSSGSEYTNVNSEEKEENTTDKNDDKGNN